MQYSFRLLLNFECLFIRYRSQFISISNIDLHFTYGHTYIHTYIYLFRKELIKKVHNYVHLNLCIALTFGLIIFLAGIDTATAVPVSSAHLYT